MRSSFTLLIIAQAFAVSVKQDPPTDADLGLDLGGDDFGSVADASTAPAAINDAPLEEAPAEEIVPAVIQESPAEE